jgi:hypothetical protein
VLNIAWLGGEGPENLIVPLHSTSDSTLILPTAIAGEPDFVHVVNAGEPYLLDASASLPGAPEASIDSEGTLWYLLQRPAESQSGVKEEWASPTRLFIPDVPGLYVFELMVRTATEPVLLSPVTTVQINAVSE